MRKQPLVIVFALVFTVAVPAIGYVSFGPWTALLFLIGYLAGFILWMVVPTTTSFAPVMVLYWVTAYLFFVHRVEENLLKFQEELSKLTGVPVPEVTSFPIILLLVASVGAWLLAPFLARRRYALGYYLVWTFFASMGITELAHFILPLFTPGPNGYFPGMISVLVLAPAAWLGMGRLSRRNA